jgi:orotate phosphoribosyltransferase
MKARRDLLLQARRLLADPPPVAEFRKLPLYFQLKHFLTPSTIANVAGEFDERGSEVIKMVMGGPHGGVHPYAHEVLRDLSSTEKKWGLV